jgi:hypothetical protein
MLKLQLKWSVKLLELSNCCVDRTLALESCWQSLVLLKDCGPYVIIYECVCVIKVPMIWWSFAVKELWALYKIL